jgi:hypothetical protein
MTERDPSKRLAELRDLVTRLPRPARIKEHMAAFHAELTEPPEPTSGIRGPRALPTGLRRWPRRQSEAARRPAARDAVSHAREQLIELRHIDDGPVRRDLIRSIFDAMHPLDAERLAHDHADDVANLPGVPMSLRATANRSIIERCYEHAISDLRFAERQLELARERVGVVPATGRLKRNPLTPYVDRVKRATGDVASLAQFRTPHVDADGVEHQRQYLGIIPSSRFSSGRVVEVFGDLARATHVLIVVPGVGNTYHDFRETRGKSETIARHIASTTRDANVAVIEWMGYEVPGWARAALAHPAVNGGRELCAFVETLDIPASADVTALGHSYGSVLLSEALRSGLRLDRAIFTGSPGVHAERVDDFGMHGKHVFALAASGDLIPRLHWHGKNPAGEPFGAVRLATDGTGHASYFKPGSLSLHNVAHVVLGRFDELVHAPTVTRSNAPDLSLEH